MVCCSCSTALKTVTLISHKSLRTTQPFPSHPRTHPNPLVSDHLIVIISGHNGREKHVYMKVQTAFTRTTGTLKRMICLFRKGSTKCQQATPPWPQGLAVASPPPRSREAHPLLVLVLVHVGRRRLMSTSLVPHCAPPVGLRHAASFRSPSRRHVNSPLPLRFIPIGRCHQPVLVLVRGPPIEPAAARDAHSLADDTRPYTHNPHTSRTAFRPPRRRPSHHSQTPLDLVLVHSHISMSWASATDPTSP